MGKEKIMMVTSFLLILLIVFSVSATVKGAERKGERIGNEYLAQKEREFRKELKSMLEQEGYSNAGITMTKIREQNDTLVYTVKMNHKKFSNLSEKQRTEMEEGIAEISFQECERILQYQFL